MVEYGKVKSTKKGWKALRVAGADIPKPDKSSTQNALAFHSVMVSGMVYEMLAFPVELMGVDKGRVKKG